MGLREAARWLIHRAKRMNRSRARTRNWTILTSHGAVLMYLARHPEDTVLAVSGVVGLRERTTSRIIRDLREDGFLRIERQGRKNVYSINYDAPLRRPGLADLTLRSYLKDLSSLSAKLNPRGRGAQHLKAAPRRQRTADPA